MSTIAINNGYSRILLAALLAIAMLVMGGCGEIHSRAEFTTLVTDKSEDEVKKNIGKPASVDTSNPKLVTWTYTGATFDGENKNAQDAKTIVSFAPNPANGKLKVVSVKFN